MEKQKKYGPLTKENIHLHVSVTESGCWEWKFARMKFGYGVKVQQDGKKHSAHRVAYELFNGPIGDGLLVCHKCDNPPCVNPDHMFLGDQSANMKDCYSKGRRVAANRKLTRDKVDEIIRRSKSGEKQRLLAREFGVAESTVSQIVSGSRWK